MNTRKIGTVETLAMRVYPIDPKNLSLDRTEVVVEPGVFDLYEDDNTRVRFWIMTGEINRRGVHEIEAGMFGVFGSDEGNGVEVTFPSPQYSRLGWEDFISHPQCIEGDPAQRLKVTVRTEVTS